MKQWEVSEARFSQLHEPECTCVAFKQAHNVRVQQAQAETGLVQASKQDLGHLLHSPARRGQAGRNEPIRRGHERNTADSSQPLLALALQKCGQGALATRGCQGMRLAGPLFMRGKHQLAQLGSREEVQYAWGAGARQCTGVMVQRVMAGLLSPQSSGYLLRLLSLLPLLLLLPLPLPLLLLFFLLPLLLLLLLVLQALRAMAIRHIQAGLSTPVPEAKVHAGGEQELACAHRVRARGAGHATWAGSCGQPSRLDQLPPRPAGS